MRNLGGENKMLTITALRLINKAQYQLLLWFLITCFSEFILCKYSLFHSKGLFVLYHSLFQ